MANSCRTHKESITPDNPTHSKAESRRAEQPVHAQPTMDMKPSEQELPEMPNSRDTKTHEQPVHVPASRGP